MAIPITRAYWVESLTINGIAVAGFLGSNAASFYETVNRDRIEFSNSLANHPGPIIGWTAGFKFDVIENIPDLLDAQFPETSSSDSASIYGMTVVVRDTSGRRVQYTGQVYMKQELDWELNRRKTGSFTIDAEFIFNVELDKPYTRTELTGD